MDSKIIEQDTISSMNSDIPTNYPPISSSTEMNQYPPNQYQEPYYPPPQQPYLNQNYQIPQNQAINQNYPVNNYPQQIPQPTPPPVYNAPLGVQVEQNISQIPHKSITQPQTNVFLIKRIYESLFYYTVPFFGAIFFILLGIIFFVTSDSFASLIFLTLLALLIMLLGLCNCVKLDHEYELILGDDNFTIINKAFCCRKRISIYQKNELMGFDMKMRNEERHGRGGRVYHVDVYDFILLFKNGRNEKFFSYEVAHFTKEETNYLLYYVNNYIRKV